MDLNFEVECLDDEYGCGILTNAFLNVDGVGSIVLGV